MRAGWGWGEGLGGGGGVLYRYTGENVSCARILSHPRKAEKISFRKKVSFQQSESTTVLPTSFL